MRKNEIMELLRAACGCALRQDMRGYHHLMEQAQAAIGQGNSTMNPRGFAQRCEVAAILRRFRDCIAK